MASHAHADTGMLSFREPVQGAATADPASNGGLAPKISPDFSVRIEPMLWYVAPTGDLKLPVRSGTGPGGFTTEGNTLKVDDLNIDEPRLRPAGRIAIISGDWMVSFWGFDYSASVDRTSPGTTGRIGAVALTPADQANVSFDFASYELTLGYRAYSHDFAKDSQKPEDAVDVALSLFVVGGVRLYDTSIRVERVTGTFASAEAEHSFIEPILGVRTELDITRAFSIQVQATGGTLPLDDTSSYSFDIAASFHYRPIDWADVFIGYRLLYVSLEDGENLDKFEYNGALAGLFAGFTIRF